MFEWSWEESIWAMVLQLWHASVSDEEGLLKQGLLSSASRVADSAFSVGGLENLH